LRVRKNENNLRQRFSELLVNPICNLYAKSGNEMKRDYGNNGRSAGFQPACSKKVSLVENMQAGSPRTGRYFRNLSSFHYR
jgi:hypothetical protein